MPFQGRRLPDTPLDDLPDELDRIPFGSYWKVMSRKDPDVALTPEDIQHEGNPGLTNTVWGLITPNGLYGMLSIHTVREEEDNTISVRPGDGSSNSILVSGGSDGLSWHGYIEHGIWTEV